MKLSAQELRIGNYLQDAKGKLAPVEGLSKNKIKAYSGMVTEMPLKPIPLTEEWLLKFGFDNNWKYIGDNKIEINIKEKEFWLGGDDACIWGHGFYGKIEYVHQLQNLYFALTGEELTIKKTESI